MPVLIVSMKTSPQPGFSRKRSTRRPAADDDDAELERVRHRFEGEGCDPPPLGVELDERWSDPRREHVTGDDEELVVQLVPGV